MNNNIIEELQIHVHELRLAELARGRGGVTSEQDCVSFWFYTLRSLLLYDNRSKFCNDNICGGCRYRLIKVGRPGPCRKVGYVDRESLISRKDKHETV